MISLMLQGFLILLTTFLIGLPLGDFLACQVRRWLKRPRTKTDRMLAMIALTSTEPPPPQEPPPPMTYPASVFGYTTVSTPVRRDADTTCPPGIATGDPLISLSLQPPAR